MSRKVIKQEEEQNLIQIPEILAQTVAQLNQKQNIDYMMTQANKKYSIKSYNVMGLSTKKVVQHYLYIQNKIYHQQPNISLEQWRDNELRVFIWCLLAYSFIKKRNISDLEQDDWEKLSIVFNNKNPTLLEFQGKLLKKSTGKSCNWTTDEENILRQIVKPNGQTFRWKQIAQSLFVRSEKKYFRTPKQCREHWINHLDPKKVRTPWTVLQDINLLENTLKSGKKWAMISKIIGGTRTEHMVKNRFNSLLKQQRKKQQCPSDEKMIIKKALKNLNKLNSAGIQQLRNSENEKILIKPQNLISGQRQELSLEEDLCSSLSNNQEQFKGNNKKTKQFEESLSINSQSIRQLKKENVKIQQHTITYKLHDIEEIYLGWNKQANQKTYLNYLNSKPLQDRNIQMINSPAEFRQVNSFIDCQSFFWKMQDQNDILL